MKSEVNKKKRAKNSYSQVSIQLNNFVTNKTHSMLTISTELVEGLLII